MHQKKWLLFHIGLLICSLSAFSQQSIEFSIDINQGCSPLNVSFTNLSSVPPGATYYWEFGNGNVSTSQNPQATYIEPGDYSVQLTVTYPGDKLVLLKENIISVLPSPSPKFTLAGVDRGCAPFATGFVNQTPDLNNSNTYTWSFGDGSKSSETNPSHNYLTGGEYDVTLIASSQAGCIASYTIPHLVYVHQPIAKFGVNQVYSCTGSLLATFNNLSVGHAPDIYEWNFGDGNLTNDINPVHNYPNQGKYSVALTVTDSLGCSNKYTATNLIEIVKTTADFTISKTIVCPNEKFTLQSTGTHANSYKWKFDDGSTDIYPLTFKSFNTAGDKAIWLIASNEFCSDSIRKVIQVERVEALFTPSDSFICQIPQSIQYIDQSIGAVSWNWSFGNGQKSTVQSPNITYSQLPVGIEKIAYDDVLEVTSIHGCKSKLIKKKSVSIYIPTVKIWPGTHTDNKPLLGCIPMMINFIDSTVYSTPFDQIVTRQWKLNNGSIFSGDTFPVSISQTGVYPVDIILTTQKGCVFTANEKISAGQKVNPDFQLIGNSTVCASNPVDFELTAPVNSLISSVKWEFGDNDTESLPFPPHFYIKTGSMDVSLTVYNFGCGSKITKPGIVSVLGPLVNIKKSPDCPNPFNYQFSAEVIDASSFTWNFNDGSPTVSDIPVVSHTFPAKQAYTVTLASQNSATGCSFTAYSPVNIEEPTARISVSNTLLCPQTPVNFDGSGSTDAAPFTYKNKTAKYLWIHQETGNEKFSDDPVQFSFAQKGEHHVSLIVKAFNGCSDTSTQTIQIYQPTVNFDSEYIDGCMPVNYKFIDKTTSESPISVWNWNFGDGNTSPEQNPNHGFNAFGKYDVSLEVTDMMGCKNKKYSNQYIKAVEPNANFQALDSSLCVGMITDFKAVSESRIISYNWSFGNGDISTLAFPQIKFPNPGSYDVKLEIVDDHNCHTSLLKPQYVKVQNYPVANFDSDDLTSNCYPFIAQFNDLSINDLPGGWKWNFGENANQSALQNPFFIYNKPGSHDVTLVTYTSFGCADTLVRPKYVNVGGPSAFIDVHDTLCKNTSVAFKAGNPINIFDIKWDFGDGEAGVGDGASHAYQQPGTIYPVMFLRADDSNTCNKTIRDTLNVLDLRADFFVDDTQKQGCIPHLVQFNNRSLNALNWNWSFGDGDSDLSQHPLHLYDAIGNFSVKLLVSHPLGCSDSMSFSDITVFPLPSPGISPDTTICVGSSAFLRAWGGNLFAWFPSNTLDSPNSASTLASPLDHTKYSVAVTDINGCTDSAHVNVYIQNPVKLPVRDTAVIIGESFYPQWNDPAVGHYSWQPANLFSCADCPNPSIFVLTNTSLVLSVTDTTGCFIIDHPFKLDVIKKYSVDVPEAFTPNGDGINDLIFVNGWGIKDVVFFRIFNRLGQKLFDSNHIDNGWDGHFNGVLQPSETYSYTVAVKTYGDQTITKHGTFKIIR